MHSPTPRNGGSWDGGKEKTPNSNEQKQLSEVKTLVCVERGGGGGGLHCSITVLWMRDKDAPFV